MPTMAKPTASYTLLKFTATWCPPCQAMEKSGLLEAFVERHPEVKLQKVDVDAHPKKADAFGIRAIPTLVFLGAKGEELSRGNPGTPGGVERLFTAARKR